MNEKLEFLASLPNIMSALKIGGDGLRLQLDVPETEKHKALPLAMLNNKVLRVTVEIEES